MVRILVTVSFAALVGIAGWWTKLLNDKINEHQIELEQRDAEIATLGEEIRLKDERIAEQVIEIARQAQQILELETALALLKIDHRIARVEVLEQTEVTPGKYETRIRFVELGTDGKPLGEGRELVIAGKVLYVEGLVIKFEDDYVEAGDFLRGTSLCLFKRAFSENQSPEQGTQLDSVGIHPLPYSGDDVPDEFYNELWERFWDYANDPQMAAEKGVRAVHGEAPFVELRSGKTYRLELRSSGGLSIQAE